MKKEETGIKDSFGKMIREGDLLKDSFPSKGIVVLWNGEFWVTSDYKKREITKLDNECDLLNNDLIINNKMVIIGNVYENSELIYSKLPPMQ